MKYSIQWCEKKSINVGGVQKQLLEGTFKGVDGIEIQATIWRDSKDGSVFPNFDTIMNGSEIEANPWTNPKTGKIALYPIKEAVKGSFAPRAGNSVAIGKAMDKKIEAIGDFQDSKNISIKLSQAMRDGVQLAIEEQQYLKNPIDLSDRVLYWRKFILDNWGDVTDTKQPF